MLSVGKLIFVLCEISGSHGVKYDDENLLGYSTVSEQNHVSAVRTGLHHRTVQCEANKRPILGKPTAVFSHKLLPLPLQSRKVH
jgi:hypothetical protein